MSFKKAPTRSLKLLALAFLMAFTAATGAAMTRAAEAPVDWKQGGKWSHLSKYIGTYQTDAILNDPQVKAELKEITKGRKVDLNKELAVSAAIGFENDCLVLKGNQEQRGDTNRAYMEVCLNAGTINLGVFDNDQITIFSRFGDYKYMSEGMRSWVYFQNNPPAILDKPANVQFVVKPE